jgi:hypothetical protein
LGALEVLARTDFARAHLPPPSVGSSHNQFEAKLAALDALANEEGHIECIVLGSSMVDRGFDPEAYNRGIQARTGQSMTCFNFGVKAVTASEAGILARILVDKYQPRVLIYGISVRDFDDDVGADAGRALMGIPWTQYYQGNPSLAGWLSHHSRAYGYYLTLTSRFDDGDWSSHRKRVEERLVRRGYGPQKPLGQLPEIPQQVRRRLGDFKTSADDWAGLQQVVELKEQGVQVILVEMPIPSKYVRILPDGEQTYTTFIGVLEAYARANDTPLWLSNSEGLVSDDQWADHHHLGENGAEAFSEWLGYQVGGLVRGEEAASVPRERK